MKYVTIYHGKDLPKITCKWWFRTDGPAYQAWLASEKKFVDSIFRWKFERVQMCTKVQKPYMVLTAPITLSPRKPVKAVWGSRVWQHAICWPYGHGWARLGFF